MTDEPLPTPPITEPPKSKQKKILLIVISVIVLVVIVLVVLIFATRGSQNQSTDLSRLTLIQENVCPDSIFSENGVERVDYLGMPYLLNDQRKGWIMANCLGKTRGVVDNGPKNDDANIPQSNNQNNTMPENETEPPLLLGSLGFNFGEYNAATQSAGDIKFTRTPLPFNQIYSPFGQPDPRPGNSGMRNPQPVVILPLGTKVQAIVTGEVVEVKELYSGDMTVWIAKSKTSHYFYEIEHIKNPTVAIGDKVTAGDIIGEVSDYDSHNNPGFGLVEIGILFSDGPGVPKHICPMQYLDPTIKSSVESNLNKLYAAWNDYLGQQIYNYTTFETPGCVTTAQVES